MTVTGNSTRPLILSENKLDYKYQRISGYLDVEYIHLPELALLKFLVSRLLPGSRRQRPVFWHVRYLKWRGHFFTIPFYVVMILLAHLAAVQITWSCHNIYEHKFNSHWQNNVLRWILAFAARDIIVFDAYLKQYLPRSVQSRIRVTSFGEFRSQFRETDRRNPDFAPLYEAWCRQRGIDRPDFMYVSTATIQFDKLIAALESAPDLNALIIAPRASAHETRSNILFINQYVYQELEPILEQEGIVGLIAHENISVPTSIYLYASFQKPILALRAQPVARIVTGNGLGETFQYGDDLQGAWTGIRERYPEYQENQTEFIARNTWSGAADIHRELWE